MHVALIIVIVVGIVLVSIVDAMFRCDRCGGWHGGNFCFRRRPGGWDEF